jgi:hypothetical protein
MDYDFLPSSAVSIRTGIFADVLSHLVNLWPNARLDELLSWRWAAARDHL